MEHNRRWWLRAAALAGVAGVVGTSLTAPAAAAHEPSVLPGTAEWAEFTTHEEMLAAVQLPAGQAAAMSTDQLVTAVLDYPMFWDALAHDKVQAGVERVAEGFNGLSELLRRPDAGTVLARRYEAFDVAVPPVADLAAAGEHTFTAWKLELVLAQPSVLTGMSAGQRESLLRVATAKSDAKRTQPEFYGEPGLEPTGVLLGRTLAAQEGWEWRDSEFLRDGLAVSPDVVEDIRRKVAAHFAEPSGRHPAGDFSTDDYYSNVRTPRGSAVRVMVVTVELSRADIAAINAYVARTYPRAKRETNATRKYNCHSYAWHSQATTNNLWMSSPGDDTYWNDGSFTAWSKPRPWYDTMRVSWKSDDHSGINVGDGKTQVRSKWGQFPRMLHAPTYTPYDDSSRYPYYKSS
ncbi:hypothetical protein ABZX92_39535 [Lentzea sp. NPDC006480]|uniref:hypothetical protein n=1 Tax=Lentzea sp. NPDC006480 TaxID=3157176 RepID=UPI0033A3A977